MVGASGGLMDQMPSLSLGLAKDAGGPEAPVGCLPPVIALRAPGSVAGFRGEPAECLKEDPVAAAEAVEALRWARAP